MAQLFPVNVQQIGSELAIAWNDGSESFLPLELLRRACPCAICGGEPDVLGKVTRHGVTYTAESFQMRAFQVIGGYAIQPAWNDGHATGLFPFPYLQRLGAAAAAEP